MWFELGKKDERKVSTPSLAVYPNRVQENIERMLAYVDSPTQLCPHVKTHKTREILRFFLVAGVRQFKCSTIAETEMVAMEKAEFALLVVQPVGQNVTRLAQLAAEYPDIEVAAVVDNLASLAAIANAAEQHHVVITLCLDIDNGMGRTGIRCGALAKKIYQQIVNYRSLIRGGLHVYDGHIHELDPAVRQQSVDAAMECVSAFRDDLVAGGDDVPRLIVGGTPSFPIHAAHANRICSPGTPVFWDANYGERFPDLEFLPAAVLLTRVISKLSQKQVCVDLGYKAIAAEMAPPRANFLNVDVVSEKIHSEEHLVIEIAPNCDLEVGDLLYVLPRHICPTVALHQKMLVVEDGMIVDQWPVTARDRSISI